MSTDFVEYSQDGVVAVLSMVARPHNFICAPLLESILEGLEKALRNGARAVVLNSKLRNFCAGAESEFLASQTTKDGKAPSYRVTKFLEKFEAFPLPTIASVHGVCVGGGFELALACDYIVASSSSKMGSVEITVGLHPLMGAIQRIAQRAGAARANEMAMLGRRYDAQTLERWNLVNLVVTDERLAEATMTIAQEVGNGPTVAHAATKQLVRIATTDGVAAADEAMSRIQQAMWSSDDAQKGVEAYKASNPNPTAFSGN